MTVRLSEQLSEQALQASGAWSLKRTNRRLSERAQLQHHLFRVLGIRGRSEFSKMLLSTCLITVFTL